MLNQFEKYGLWDFSFYITDRWTNLDTSVKLKWHSDYSKTHHGSCISHLESMRQWYLTTNEPYAIFSDDDIDLSTSENWNFTFREFIDNLPHGWECVQLMRLNSINSKKYEEDDHSLAMQILRGRWWGVCALMTREYVKKCLDRHITGPFEYDLRVSWSKDYNGDPDTISYVENVLFMNNGSVLNFPLFVELINESTVYDSEERMAWKLYRTKHYHDKWKHHGSKLDIKKALTLPS